MCYIVGKEIFVTRLEICDCAKCTNSALTGNVAVCRRGLETVGLEKVNEVRGSHVEKNMLEVQQNGKENAREKKVSLQCGIYGDANVLLSILIPF